MLARRGLLSFGALALLLASGCRRKGTNTPRGEMLAAEFALTDSAGVGHTLASLTAAGPTVLVFYRGFW